MSQTGSGTISGKIITSDKKAAAQVTVHITGTKRSTTTNEEGSFGFKNIQPGTYELLITLVDYETATHQVTVEANATANVEIQLKASDKQLQEVVVRAYKNSYTLRAPSPTLKLNEPLLEVPQNIQMVTSTALANQQVTSMSDGVLRNVSGAVRLEHWGDLYTRVNSRGSQVQAFRNGFNVVSSYWGPLTEDMSFVDHIEFVKGPAGFMLANGDPAGLYNVVTKKPTGETKGEASFTVGSYDMYRATLDLDGKLSKDGKLLYRLNLMGQNKKSHRPYEYNNRYSIAPVISYQIDEKTKLTAEYTLQHAKMSDVGSYYVFSQDGYGTLPLDFTTYAPGLAPTVISDQSMFLNLQHQFTPAWKLTVQGSYFNYKQTGTSLWPAAVNPDGTMIRQVGIWDAQSDMAMAQAFVNGDFTTGKIRHRVLAGFDAGTKNYEADWSQYHPLDLPGEEFDTKNPDYGTPPNGYPVWDRSLNLEARAVNSGGLMDMQYSGFYLQDELGFFNNRLRLTLAGRYSFVSQSAWGDPSDKADHFTPRIGLSYSIDNQTSVYALYDQAFIPQSGKLASGKTPKPVTGNNVEFGIKKDWNGRWTSTASVYRIIKNNELTADPNSPPTSGLSVVLGQKIAQGIEFDLRGNIIDGLTVVLNYAYTDAKVSKVTEGVPGIAKGDVVPGYAKHTANAWLTYKLTDGILKGTGVSLGGTYLADRATNTFSTSAPEQNLPDYFRMDGGIFWEKDNIRLTVNGFNLLNSYLYSGSYESWMGPIYSWQTEPPRNFRFSVNYRF